MAITKTITMAVPMENDSNEVVRWNLEMKYENDSEDDATYFTHTFDTVVTVEDSDFVAAGKGTFNLAALTALCPTTKWDGIFASQVDSVITNAPAKPVADLNFTIPTE
jgi:hypothetical protein